MKKLSDTELNSATRKLAKGLEAGIAIFCKAEGISDYYRNGILPVALVTILERWAKKCNKDKSEEVLERFCGLLLLRAESETKPEKEKVGE